MTKFIIHNDSKLSDLEVLEYVLKVIEKGKISIKSTSYCSLTTWKDIAVHCDMTKGGSFTFNIQDTINN